MSKKVEALVERAKEIQVYLDSVKPLYAELDEITVELAGQRGLAKYGCIVVDNFATKNTSYKVAAVKRFELKWGDK